MSTRFHATSKTLQETGVQCYGAKLYTTNRVISGLVRAAVESGVIQLRCKVAVYFLCYRHQVELIWRSQAKEFSKVCFVDKCNSSDALSRAIPAAGDAEEQRRFLGKGTQQEGELNRCAGQVSISALLLVCLHTGPSQREGAFGHLYTLEEEQHVKFQTVVITFDYRKFVDCYARIAAPLYQLLLKYAWTPAHTVPFENLKVGLCSSLILIYPRLDPPFVLQSDFS